jgi:hypothetical protein
MRLTYDDLMHWSFGDNGVWEAAAKYGLLPLPFFPPPQAILEVLVEQSISFAVRLDADHRGMHVTERFG